MPAQGALATALGVAGLLVVYGNGLSFLTGPAGVRLPGGNLLPNLVLVGALVVWALKTQGLSREALGLGASNLALRGAWGLPAGVAMALPALGFFAFPLVLPAPVTYAPVVGLPLPNLVWRVLVEMLIGTAVCEELLFRGVLQAALLRSVPLVPALAATNLAFAAWHGVVNYQTWQATNLGALTHLAPLALATGLATVFAAGAIFSLLRHFTGGLLGSVVAHWLVDALIVVSLFALAHR